MTIYILVVSKNDKTVTLLRQITDEFDCHLVRSSTMSLALYLAQKNKPALIISDLTLADGDGASLIREVKADKELKAIPFVVLLEEDSPASLKQTLLSYGAAQVIEQLDARRELTTLITTLINRSDSNPHW
jgi:DNA-binding response OmpR family regulator